MKKFSLDLAPINWVSKCDLDGPVGIRSWYGCSGLPGDGKDKPKTPIDYMMVKITIPGEHDHHKVNHIKSLFSGFQVTSSVNDKNCKLDVVCSDEIINRTKVKRVMYLVKNPCFDEIYKVMKKYNMVSGERNFMEYGNTNNDYVYGEVDEAHECINFNSDFVQVVEKEKVKGGEKILKTVVQDHTLVKKTGNYTVRIKILVKDIEKNWLLLEKAYLGIPKLKKKN